MFEKRKQRKFETERADTLSEIHDERSEFESMLQRARVVGENPKDNFVSEVFAQFDKLAEWAQKTNSSEELNSASYDADLQGQLRAYICPSNEVEDEGRVFIEEMEEWNVPAPVLERLSGSLLPTLKKQSDSATKEQSLTNARSALHSIYAAHDSWDRYTLRHEEKMKLFSIVLAAATLVLISASVFAFRFHYTTTLFAGLVCAGAAGGCVSVVSKTSVITQKRP